MEIIAILLTCAVTYLGLGILHTILHKLAYEKWYRDLSFAGDPQELALLYIVLWPVVLGFHIFINIVGAICLGFCNISEMASELIRFFTTR
jgi:hypothetical protein